MKTENTGPFWQETQIPDGTYQGTWGGYEVKMKVNGITVKFNTKSGVRGLNIPVTVIILNGEAEVKTNEKD